jgi:hypothetical protein
MAELPSGEGGSPMIQIQTACESPKELEALLQQFGAERKTWWYREKYDEKIIKSWSEKDKLHEWDTGGRIFHSGGEARYSLSEGTARVVLTGTPEAIQNLVPEKNAVSRKIYVDREEKAALPDIKDAPDSLILQSFHTEDNEAVKYFWTAE